MLRPGYGRAHPYGQESVSLFYEFQDTRRQSARLVSFFAVSPTVCYVSSVCWHTQKIYQHPGNSQTCVCNTTPGG
jgi:predicted membrane channel-forming protein YqfA (hemolysin III family)